MNYKNYTIEPDNTGYAPKSMTFGIFKEEEYIGSGETIEECKKLIDENILENYLDFNSNIKAGQEAIELLKELRGFAPYCTDHRQRVDDILSKVSVDTEVSQNEA